MFKRRSGAPRLLLVMPMSVLGAGCAIDGPADNLDADRRPQATEVTSPDAETRADSTAEPIDDTLPGIIGVPAGEGDETTPGVEGMVAGTDSSTPVATTDVPPVLRARLEEFGQLYLGYDYRTDHETRLQQLAPLVSPSLLDELATPIPPALAELFSAEQRVATASALDVVTIDVNVYRLSYEVVTTTEEGDPSTELRQLVVAVDGEQLVDDVL